jgi:hypothetical protein
MATTATTSLPDGVAGERTWLPLLVGARRRLRRPAPWVAERARAGYDSPLLPARRLATSGRLRRLRELLEDAFAEGRQVVR